MERTVLTPARHDAPVTGTDPARDAASRYHDLLTTDVAVESHAQLEHAQRLRGLLFDGRPLCTVLRPRFLSHSAYRELQHRIRPLLAAFRRAHDRAIADASFRAKFGLADWEEQLLAVDPGYTSPSPTSRLDCFFAPGAASLGLTEYNAETPAGAAYSDALADAFFALPVMRAFASEHEIISVPARHGVVAALLDAWREFSGSRARPRVAILDWRGVPTSTEFELYEEQFQRQGLECIIDDPRHTEYTGGRLLVGGTPVDVIYKRVLISELVERCGLHSPVVRAVRDGAVCLVDGFRCKVLHKKASLAVLSDETNAGMFNAGERQAVADCVPWTRVVEERQTVHEGREVDLVPFIVERREHFVLKPNDDYGGRGITLGWHVDDSAWGQAVREALRSPHIVQERVTIPTEPYPSCVDGQLRVIDRMYDTAPFITNGAYMEGILTRLSTAALLNVTAGGGSTVPTFIVERR